MTDTRSRRLLPLLTHPSEPSRSLKRSANSPHAVAKAYRAHTQGHRVLKPSVCACVALRKAFRAYTFRYACAVHTRVPGPYMEGRYRAACPTMGYKLCSVVYRVTHSCSVMHSHVWFHMVVSRWYDP